MTACSRSSASFVGRRLALWLVLAAFGSTAPLTVDVGASGLQLDPATALAKSGKGKDGDGSDDDDDDDDDDHDRDDRDDDDHDRDDDRDDVRPGDGSDDRHGGTSVPVVRVELTSTGINVIYRDGSRETLADGIYRREDSAGRIVETRAANGADLVRMRAQAGGRIAPVKTETPGSVPPGQPLRIRLRGQDVIVEYTNGWTEAVARGRYRLTDRYGHVAVDRAATAADRARLRGLAGR